jgi:pimeloyl-ACP methyl ester carboxylesterase
VPTVRAGALTLSYRETGSGDPVLLINGTGESSHSFAGLMAGLGALRCIAMDLRDTGTSTADPAGYTPGDLAGDAAAVLDTIDAGPAHIVGFSLGGAVAQELAIARPDLVRSLVLLSTWARSDAWFISQMRSWQVLRSAFGDDGQGFDRALEPWMFSPATMADVALLGSIHGMWDEAPSQSAAAFNRQCDADIAHDAAGRLGAVDVPALVLVGDDDICTPPRYAREMAGLLPRAHLLTVAAAGHCAVFERPGEVAAAVETFLRAVP